MTNSMKDLLLGLGFKPAPPPVHKDVQAPAAKNQPRSRPADERVRQATRPERSDAPHRQHQGHPSQHETTRRQPSHQPPSQRHPSQPRNPAHTSAHVPQKPNAEPGARIDRPRREPPQQRTREEIDLARAYAIRAQKEKDERIEAERLKQEAARIKREAKAKIAELLRGKTVNDANADLPRHFDYNGKIRRVHVTEAQLKSLNGGDLGVVQLDGRYLLVDAGLAREVHVLLPSLVALLVDPNAPVTDDPYADPQYKVPDDLVW